MTREEALAWRPDAEDEAFCAVYGDWDPLTPVELRDLMAGYPQPWWVVGGWSVEAFTGVARFHEDIDLVVYTEHVAQLREQLGGVFHLWSNDGVRYLRPEVTLLFKAKQHRVKDRIDLDNVWPLLDDERRAWLRESLRRLHPDHPWQAVLDA